MNIKNKKIIAREFLILIAVTTVGLLSFLCTYFYNWNKSSQVKKADEKIVYQTHLADSLSKSFKDKTIDGKDYISRVFFALNHISDEYGIPNHFTYSEPDFRQKILTDKNFRDSIYRTFQNKVEGFTITQPQFDSSIDKQLTADDISKQKQSQEILQSLKVIRNEKEKTSSSILTYNEQVVFGLKVLILTAFLFFVLRFVFYAINWSIKTIKQK